MLKNLKSRVAVATAAIVAAPFALADTSDPGVAAITDLGAKGTTYITAAFGVAVIIAGGFWGIRMMKKSFSAAK